MEAESLWKATVHYMSLCVKRCQNQTCHTISAGMYPPLCLRGGLGRTRVTWWSGRPCVGSSDRPSQDAERDRGEEYDGTEGGGEELESSHRPDSGEEQWNDYRGCETQKATPQSRRQKNPASFLSKQSTNALRLSDFQDILHTYIMLLRSRKEKSQ